LFGAAELLERSELRPPREHEAAVAPAGAAAADVRLDDDDVDRRFALLQSQRRPESRVSTPGDADIGSNVSLECRRVLFPCERLVEPQAPHATTLERQPSRGPVVDRLHLRPGRTL